MITLIFRGVCGDNCGEEWATIAAGSGEGEWYIGGRVINDRCPSGEGVEVGGWGSSS